MSSKQSAVTPGMKQAIAKAACAVAPGKDCELSDVSCQLFIFFAISALGLWFVMLAVAR